MSAQFCRAGCSSVSRTRIGLSASGGTPLTVRGLFMEQGASSCRGKQSQALACSSEECSQRTGGGFDWKGPWERGSVVQPPTQVLQQGQLGGWPRLLLAFPTLSWVCRGGISRAKTLAVTEVLSVWQLRLSWGTRGWRPRFMVKQNVVPQQYSWA